MASPLGQLLADPDFVALPPDRQAALRQEYFDKVVARDPDYRALDSAGQSRIRAEVLGAPTEPGLVRGFLGATGERFMQGAKTLGTPGTGALGTAGALVDLALPMGGGVNYLGRRAFRALGPGSPEPGPAIPELGGLGMLPRTPPPSTEQAEHLVGNLAEIVGGAVPGYTLGARALRKGIAATRQVPDVVDLTVPRVEIPRTAPRTRTPSDVAELLHPEPYPKAETVRQSPFQERAGLVHEGVERFPGARPQVPHPIVPISQAESNARTLDAAHQLFTGSNLARPLDLGTVGKKRALQHIESDLKTYWGDTLRVDATNVHRAGDSVDLPPSRRMDLPDGDAGFAADPPPLGAPSTFAVWVGKTKEAVGSKFGRVFGFPFRELVKDIPGLRNMNASVERAVDISHEIKRGLFARVTGIYAPVAKDQDAIHRINAVLDDQAPLASLSMMEQGVAIEMRALFNQLDPDAGTGPVRNYFSRIRDRAFSPSADIKETREVVLETTRDYIPIQIEAYLSRAFRPYFEKARTMPGVPATELGLGPVYAYMQAYTRKLLLNGGIDPNTGRQVAGILDTMREGIRHIPDDDAWRGIALRWINDTLGVPRGTYNPRVEQLVRAGKVYQFARTIGGNLLAPLVNLTGLHNTASLARVDSLLVSPRGMANPLVREEALRRGIVSQLTKADLEAITAVNDPELAKGFAGMAERGAGFLVGKAGLGKWFRGSENLVRLHAFSTGLEEARHVGLVGEAAANFAHDFVTKTQFRYSREALPSGFRPTGAGQLLSQYKTFPINQALFLKNLAVDDARDLAKLATGQVPWDQLVNHVPSRSAKAWGLMTLVFGSDAALAGWDKTLNWMTTGRDEHLVTGLLPAIGIHLANQVGLGVLPVEDFRMLYWYLPGPMAAQLMDAMSLGSILVPGDKTAPFGRNFDFSRGLEGFGQPMTAEQFASKLSRMGPAGVGANRFRQAYIEALAVRSGQPLRAPQTLPQAFGREAIGPDNPLVRTNVGPGDVMKTLVGVQDPGTALRFEARGEQAADVEHRRQLVAEVVRLRTLGRDAEADQLLEWAQKKYGLDVRVGREAMRGAIRRSQDEPAARVRQLPRDLRERALQRLEAIEAED